MGLIRTSIVVALTLIWTANIPVIAGGASSGGSGGESIARNQDGAGLIGSAVSAVAVGTGEVSTAVVAPGDSIWLPTAKGSRFTWVKFTNQGPGAAEIEISSSSYNEVFVIEEGGEVALMNIFEGKQTQIVNKSTSATVRIDSRWL